MWDEFSIADGETIHIEVGALSLWIEHRGEEYAYAYTYSEESSNSLAAGVLQASNELPEDLVWNRYIVQDPAAKFQLKPLFPDRAVVVIPEFPLKLSPGSDVLFYVSVPYWIRVLSGSRKKIQFLEIPSQVLSITWFGDTMNGELCYALRTRALRNIEDHGMQPQRIICPVRIVNNGDEVLDFKSLCVHVEHLKVFSGTDHLWSNEVTISYKGNEHPSEIRFLERVPKYEKKSVLLSPERVSSQRKIISKSFGLFKTFTTFD
jgi:hypothetical protein